MKERCTAVIQGSMVAPPESGRGYAAIAFRKPLLAALCLAAVCGTAAAQAPTLPPVTSPPPVPAQAGSSPAPHAPVVATPGTAPKETHITSAQGKELFRSVDQIMQFASQDSGLPIKHDVKRTLTTRAEVEKYITDRFHEDKDTKRMERSEIVLKKFGLLDRDFHLQTFLVSLLKEQIAGYYDNKTKTVNLLDWIEPEQQKPVLAHELTHALQDQHLDLEKWGDQSIEGLSRDVDSDNRHIATDEIDTARDAVAEGQAMAVFVDWGLKPKNVTLRTIPNVMADEANNAEASDADSPVLARAPLLLQQSLLFPYREGLNFEQVLLQDKGTQPAFAGALDRPPSSSYEIMNPQAYEKGVPVPVLHMPDIHPLIDSQYNPYDIGAMGELDVRMVAELFGGKPVGAAMAQQWDGGLYYAAQAKTATTEAEQASTASVAIFYQSQWKTEAAATQFAALYASSLNRKYSSVTPDRDGDTSGGEQVFKTEEGPVLIVRTGKQVFISESFPLPLARKLQLLLSAQPSADDEQVNLRGGGIPVHELTSPLGAWMHNTGIMRAALRP